MYKPVSEYVRSIAAGVLVLDDTPSDKDIDEKRKTTKKLINLMPTDEKPMTAPLTRNVPDSPERDIRESKRPDVRRPRRQPTFQSGWSGEGVKEKRREYQQEYRAEHGNK
jgi:hypothetical protein